MYVCNLLENIIYYLQQNINFLQYILQYFLSEALALRFY